MTIKTVYRKLPEAVRLASNFAIGEYNDHYLIWIDAETEAERAEARRAALDEIAKYQAAGKEGLLWI